MVSIGLAVARQLTGVSLWLMMCGSAVALAVYDLFLLDITLGSNSSGEQTRHYENHHLQSLALA
jgi:hypothetical protein